MLDAYYRIATPLLMGSYSIMNDAKTSVKPVDMADVEADRGGKGKERGIGERRAFFSPLPPLTLFFCDSDPGYGCEAA